MALRVLSLEKGWHLKDREPLKGATRLSVINPKELEVIKSAPVLMTVRQMAEITLFSECSISEWCRTKVIRAYKVQGEWRITREALAEFLMSK